MADIRKLINEIAAQEVQLRDTEFFAPCVRGGKVRSRVANIIYTFSPQPQDFEGWGIFQPVNEKTAEMVEEPSLVQVAEYLKLLKPLRLRLAYVLQGQTWLAYPVNESDMQQRLGIAKPAIVHLVTEGGVFEPIIARWDGGVWWFDEVDRRGDPLVGEQLRSHLRSLSDQNIRFAGMTPEMRTVYDLALQQTEEYQRRRQQQQSIERQRETRQTTKQARRVERPRRRRTVMKDACRKRCGWVEAICGNFAIAVTIGRSSGLLATVSRTLLLLTKRILQLSVLAFA